MKSMNKKNIKTRLYCRRKNIAFIQSDSENWKYTKLQSEKIFFFFES